MSKKNKYGPMVEASKSKTKEVKALIKEFPKLGIPTKIRKSDEHGYTVACITKSTDRNGVTTARLQVITKGVNVWEAMTDHSNKAFNCHIVLILHEPVPIEEEVEDTGTTVE